MESVGHPGITPLNIPLSTLIYKLKNFLLYVVIYLGISAGANAELIYSPIHAGTLTGTNFTDTSINNRLNGPTVDLSSATSVDLGANGSAYADISAGKTGAVAHGLFETFAMWADVLTFASDTTVNYSVTLDGILSSIAGAGTISGQVFLGFYDITGLDTWIGTRKDTIIGLNNFHVDVPRVSRVSITRSMNDAIVFDGSGFDRTVDRLSRDGTAHNINLSASNSFDVVAEREYGVYMFTLANSYTNSSADFGNTGSLDIFDTGGVAFTSASSVFINTTPVMDISEPANLTLFALGVIALTMRRKFTGALSNG